jgi:hypothetical protein
VRLKLKIIVNITTRKGMIAEEVWVRQMTGVVTMTATPIAFAATSKVVVVVLVILSPLHVIILAVRTVVLLD